ncbi:heterokaryon incompatibility protein-domain-containing protein [Lasiosphaeris hirsuta]|uniref:Heterokaryon incompatibility protein-domain-containing protein n=1 Tax=Lasiosphaeris hirsuta TaxID=260670 RepID=A0AA40A7H0_9PEZI|nr:heterokaryon incompatibility protein-domain-containing protein [Lasiosphaeris hirsuta]
MSFGPRLLPNPEGGLDPDEGVRNARAWYRSVDLPPEDKSLHLCSRHRILALTWKQFEAWPIDQDLPPHASFGTLLEIKAKSQYCSFCRLICQAVGEANPYESDTDVGGVNPYEPDTDVVGCWIRDGELAASSPTTTSLRMRVVPHQIGAQEERLPFQPFDVVPFDSGHGSSPTLFFGRQINKSQIDISLMKNWIHQCSHWHGADCRPSRQNWKTTDDKVPFIRLLDLTENCLVETSSPGSFVCLSYVWGRAPVFKTLRGNVGQMKKPGSLVSHQNSFPRSIRDAISVTRILGERFLWVDSICIVQDDDGDKEKQISVMDQVYQAASMTLVIAGGDSASSGIGGLEDGSRCAKQNTAGYSHDLTLVQLLPNCNQAIERTVWNSRGWTYQERLLSNRCLFFINDTVYFQCHRATWGEDYGAEDQRVAICAPMMDIKLSLSLDPSKILLGARYRIRTHRTAYFPEYCRLVEEYTSRDMTFDTDRILGFGAVLNIFRGVYGLSFIYGLPEEMLHESLLWQPAKKMKRVLGGKKANWPMFPSWSWAGWIGTIGYNSFHDFNGLPPLTERWRRTRPISEITLHSILTQAESSRPVRVREAGQLPFGWRAAEFPGEGTVYVQDSQPDVFHSAPPVTNINPQSFPPYGIGIRTKIGQFWLIVEDRSGKPEPLGRPFYRFGISTSTSPSSGNGPWLGSIRLPGSWRRKYRDDFSSPFWFIVLSEAYGFGPDELDHMAAGKLEPYSVLNVMLVEKLQPSTRQNQLVVERLGVGRMMKNAWNTMTEAAEILIV